MCPNCIPDIMILAEAVLQIFCSQGFFTTYNDKVGKGDNSVKYLQKFAKSLSGHLQLRPNLYAKYHDPYLRGSPDIVFTRSFID